MTKKPELQTIPTDPRELRKFAAALLPAARQKLVEHLPDLPLSRMDQLTSALDALAIWLINSATPHHQAIHSITILHSFYHE